MVITKRCFTEYNILLQRATYMVSTDMYFLKFIKTNTPSSPETISQQRDNYCALQPNSMTRALLAAMATDDSKSHICSVDRRKNHQKKKQTKKQSKPNQTCRARLRAVKLFTGNIVKKIWVATRLTFCYLQPRTVDKHSALELHHCIAEKDEYSL